MLTLALLLTTFGSACAVKTLSSKNIQIVPEPKREFAITQEARNALVEAQEAYAARRAEAWLNATDVEERLETMFSEGSFEYFAGNADF
ncbi:MAG: hypothetical protein GY822_11870 [Deltaproteobacteria bacterium]|nr:hypothetical protein [Deltaproteobacteria bacterium]